MPKPYPDGGSWRRVFRGREARIEEKAGQCPRPAFFYGDGNGDSVKLDWPMPEPPPYPGDDEALTHPDKQAIRKHGDRKTVDP